MSDLLKAVEAALEAAGEAWCDAHPLDQWQDVPQSVLARAAVEAVAANIVPPNAAVSRQFTREFDALIALALAGAGGLDDSRLAFTPDFAEELRSLRREADGASPE